MVSPKTGRPGKIGRLEVQKNQMIRTVRTLAGGRSKFSNLILGSRLRTVRG